MQKSTASIFHGVAAEAQVSCLTRACEGGERSRGVAICCTQFCLTITSISDTVLSLVITISRIAFRRTARLLQERNVQMREDKIEDITSWACSFGEVSMQATLKIK